MSSFAVELVHLDDVIVHTNADALELAQIGGYNAVVQKGTHQKGDLALYIPEAAVLPDEVLNAFGFEGKLAGSKKNRVKAIRLRGELSQGIVIHLDTLAMFLGEHPEALDQMALEHGGSVEFYDFEKGDGLQPIITFWLGMDLALTLGIEKYEATIPLNMQGRARVRPDWFPCYTDVENIKHHTTAFDEGERVIFTEKIHGTNFAAAMHVDDSELLVSSRRMVLERDDTNLYWQAAVAFKMQETLEAILDFEMATTVVLYGEVFGPGVQDLGYGVEQGSFSFRAFDIRVDGNYLDHDDLQYYVKKLGLPFVPVLYDGPFNEAILREHTDGIESISGSHVREGIVVCPAEERWEHGLGRVLLKSISPAYLLRHGGTEHQ